MKDHLTNSILPKLGVAGNSGPCGVEEPPRELCKLMKQEIFMKQSSDGIHHIGTSLNCNSKKIVYLTECNECVK